MQSVHANPEIIQHNAHHIVNRRENARSNALNYETRIMNSNDVFVCLFWRFSSHSTIFNLFWDVTITDKGLFKVWHTKTPTRVIFHLWGPVTLTCCHLAVELSLPVLTTWACPDRGPNPGLPHARRTPYHYDTIAVSIDVTYMLCLHCFSLLMLQGYII